jgi:hypothetical protein
MDPFTIIFIVIAARAIVVAAGQAAADQARTERSRAADAIRRDLQGRRTAAAVRLGRRLEAGRAAGPVYPAWWAWAAVRAARALWWAARQQRRPAERRPWAVRATTGPLGRILWAAVRGAAYGAGEARRQYRDRPRRQQGRPRPRPRPRPVAVGVCERCGVVVAAAALVVAPTRYGREASMCLTCRRAEADAARQAAKPAPEPADIEDADVVAAPAPALEPPAEMPRAEGVACTRCGDQLVAFACVNPDCPLCPGYRGPLAAEGAVIPGQFRLPVRFCPECSTQLVPATWYAVNATNADVCLFCACGSGGRPGSHPEGSCREREQVELAALGTPVDDQGREIPASPEAWARLSAASALVAEAHARAAAPAADDSRPDSPAGPQDAAPAAVPALPAPTTTGDDAMSCNGEMHTQADWDGLSKSITSQLDTIADSAENMLRCLSAREASRSQMTAAAQWADQVAACSGRGRELIAGINARQDPYVDAVQGAGGSGEVAVPGYYDEM